MADCFARIGANEWFATLGRNSHSDPAVQQAAAVAVAMAMAGGSNERVEVCSGQQLSEYLHACVICIMKLNYVEANTCFEPNTLERELFDGAYTLFGGKRTHLRFHCRRHSL